MKKALIIIAMLFCMGCLMAAAGGITLYMWAAKDLPGFTKIADYKPSLVTTVYTKNGNVLGHLYREKRFLARLDQMPDHLPKAFLAAEDKTFYQHEGIDLTAIFRAFIKNLKAGENVQGGSTITQQIIKRLLLTSEKSYERKLKEALLAYRLESYLSKDEILTIYLNEIYLGARAYGVEAAARVYFGKHVGDLTLAESAVIAGLPQAPSRYNPFRFPERAKARQKYVLGRMREENWISQEQYDEAMNQELVYKSMDDISWQKGAYYLEEVRRWLVDYLSKENMDRLGIDLDRYGEDAAYRSGLHVYTALDMRHQEAAEAALRKGLEDSTKRRGWHGPVQELRPEEFDTFLEQNDYQTEDLTPGAWVLALVTKVESKGAFVRVGARKGYIPVSTMSWARTPNVKVPPDYAAKIKNATKLLSPGDVVWASLPVPEEKKDKKAKKPQEEVAQEPEKSVDEMLAALSLEQRPQVEGALVSIEPPTGEVRALVGGYSFDRSQFNRATQARRQPGSAFKPVVYSAAMDNGLTPASMILDAPIVIEIGNKVWKPQNFSHKFSGPTLLRTALAKSMNLVTIRVAQRIGIKKVIERAKELGLEPDFPPYLPIALGAVAVTPINLCEAYTAFANQGVRTKPRMVLSVKGPWGEDIYSSAPEKTQAISPQTAYIMDSLLQAVVQSGTGYRAKALKRPVGGKTGTTNDERDAWFMGFTPYLMTGVYVGFDQLTPMGKFETGSRAASPIWLDYRMAVEDMYPEQDFPEPPGIVQVLVNGETGTLASPGCTDCYLLPFKEGTQPQYYQSPPGGTWGAPVQYSSDPTAPNQPGQYWTPDLSEQPQNGQQQQGTFQQPTQPRQNGGRGRSEDLLKQTF